MNEMNNEDILEDIIKHIEKPIFTYEEKYNYNEMWKRIKKKPFNKARIKIFLGIFLILTIIFLLISKVIYITINIHINYVIVILISFIFSLFLTIKCIKSILLKQKKNTGNIVNFYDTFLITANNKSLIKYSYNDILKINQNNNILMIQFKKRYFEIHKNELDKQTISFLENINSNISNNQKSNNQEKEIWEFLNNNLKNAKIKCTNFNDKKVLKQYYDFKYVKKRVFCINYFYVFLAYSIYVISIYDYLCHDIAFIWSIKISPVIAFVVLIMLHEFTVNNYIKKAITIFENKNIFFYKDFFLIKNSDSILKFKYNKVKNILNNNNYIFIVYKYIPIYNILFSPIIIEKNKLKKDEIDFIFNNIIKKKS